MNYVKLTIYPALEQILEVLIDIDNEHPEKNLKPIIHKVSEILNKKMSLFLMSGVFWM